MEDDDELFAMFLWQVRVDDAQIVRVVEVPGKSPQFTHLLRDAFQYDVGLDVFLVGACVVVNPFPSLQT